MQSFIVKYSNRCYALAWLVFKLMIPSKSSQNLLPLDGLCGLGL